MGWISYHADHYYKNGSINRKKECDNLFSDGYEVVKSQMVGGTYYAAVRKGEKVFGVVVLTSVNKHSYCNFSYKDIDETMGPAQRRCPDSILDLLTETDCEWALEWRRRCREYNRRYKELDGMDLGSKIRATIDDTARVYEKRRSRSGLRSGIKWWADYYYCPMSLLCEAGYEIID